MPRCGNCRDNSIVLRERAASGPLTDGGRIEEQQEMDASNRNAIRVDRAAVGATFVAAVLTHVISHAAMQPPAMPLIAAAEVVSIAADTPI